jgi:hypothetical protein
MKDKVPVDPDAELSLDNVLTNIRFRGELGYTLANYTFSADFSTVELEFVPCGSDKK